MNEFMALVKEMRTAQKEYFKLRRADASHAANDALQRSKALESRVDQEIRAAEEAREKAEAEVKAAEEAREDITEEWACTPKTIATICEVY